MEERVRDVRYSITGRRLPKVERSSSRDCTFRWLHRPPQERSRHPNSMGWLTAMLRPVHRLEHFRPRIQKIFARLTCVVQRARCRERVNSIYLPARIFLAPGDPVGIAPSRESPGVLAARFLSNSISDCRYPQRAKFAWCFGNVDSPSGHRLE